MAGASLRELWWVDGSPAAGTDRATLEELALGTLGVMTSQIIPIRAHRVAMVADYEDLALQVLGLVSPDRAPLAGAVASWVAQAVEVFAGSPAIRLDVGFSFASGPSDPAPTLLAAIAPAPGPTTAVAAFGLVRASHPVVAFPPFAGLPLVESAERATLRRAGRGRGADDVVLYDGQGLVVDLAGATLVVQRPEGLCTPAAARGAIRSPLRDRLVQHGVLTELSWDAGIPQDGCHLVLTRWGRVVPVHRFEGRTLPTDRAAAARLATAVDAALAA
ncbi:MAG: aminotransferase class IV [Cellulomonas sp.]